MANRYSIRGVVDSVGEGGHPPLGQVRRYGGPDVLKRLKNIGRPGLQHPNVLLVLDSGASSKEPHYVVECDRHGSLERASLVSRRLSCSVDPRSNNRKVVGFE